MCDRSEIPQIGNLKLGVRADVSNIQRALQSPDLNVVRHGNFCVLRNVYVYIIFWSGYINITKIPNVRHVKASVRHLMTLFKNEKLFIDPSSIRIHNISASGQFSEKHNLKILSQHFKKSRKALRVKLNLIFFPGLFIRYKGGTCTIFQNGKYTILGCKNYTRIIKIANSVCVYMKKL